MPQLDPATIELDGDILKIYDMIGHATSATIFVNGEAVQVVNRENNEEEPLDPEFNHYGVIPEGCWMDYYPVEGEQYTLNPGDPFPASYEDMDYCVYAEDNLLYGYGDNDDEVPGDGWYFSEVQQTTTAPSEVRVLESIGGIPVVAIAGMISGVMDEAITSIIIPASIRYINFIVDRFIIPDCPNLKSITHLGTMDEWNAIAFAEGWNNGYPEITVSCTDGTITIPAYGS
jgi:hypothetical protein